METEVLGPPDGRPVVLLHGGIGTGRYHWSKLLKALAERYRVHLPDLPGHGRTPVPPDRPYGRDVLVDAVAAYLRRLQPRAHVAGFSMGGHTSLALAQHEPELFASLTLVGVSIRQHRGLEEWRGKFDPEAFARAYPLWVRQVSRLHAPLGGPEAWKDVFRRDSSGMQVDVSLARLAALTCPVLLVRGDRDPAVEPAQYGELRRIWPHADEFVVPAGGHDVQLTRAQLVRPAVVDFLERAEG